jgi:hypothetical protein
LHGRWPFWSVVGTLVVAATTTTTIQ